VSTSAAGIAFLALLVLALVAVHVPLGDYMFRVYTSPRDSKVEKAIYRIVGIDPKAEQSWRRYARNVLAFSAVGVLFLFFFELFQDKLPLHLHDPATKMTPSLAWNTAVSFVTNTSWQSYAGESTEGHLVQMAGLAVQSFISGAVGMAVAVALVRGFAREKTEELGSFWVDMVRGTLRILLPIAFVSAIVLLAGGIIQNFHLHDQVVTTLNGAQQTITGGPIASQEPVKLITGDGGGFYNAQSAHPFENPSALTNLIQILLIFSIGAGGILVRRNPLVILLCLELMLNAANLALVAFSRAHGNMGGQIFALIVMVVAACEVTVGLGLIVAIYRRQLPVNVDDLNELSG